MQRTSFWLPFALALVLLTMLVGCGGPATETQTPLPEPTQVATPEPSEDPYPYPYPIAPPMPTVDPAYPGPGYTPPPGRQPEPLPVPSEGTGVVHGVLYNLQTDEIVYDAIVLYLSPVIATDAATMDAVSHDPENDPWVTPDVEGGFAFGDVPPGRYAIVVQGPLNQYLVRQGDDRSKDLIFEVEAGQTLDLGKVYTGYP
ncbi:hypothetical protein [Candidatus Chloroploca sp. Khr17]|uniref:hypothetical protein n=1 Tax=Candidatus Chloroploca sp. Khr17 TaxID=2496869 RepID=UPI00101BFF07|nr:hypothetical protein [Candidatus Chloroploca sp. Khr17]